MESLGKMMVAMGAMIVIAGLVLWLGTGRWGGVGLPGDIHFRRGPVTFYFPVVTCLVVSVVLSVLFRWISR